MKNKNIPYAGPIVPAIIKAGFEQDESHRWYQNIGSSARSALRKRIREAGTWSILTPEEKRCIPISERSPLMKGNLEEWEARIEEARERRRKGDFPVRQELVEGREKLKRLKEELSPAIQAYRGYLESGDLGERESAVAGYLVMIEDANNVKQVMDLWREVIKVMGHYIERHEVKSANLYGGLQGDADALLARLKAKNTSAPELPVIQLEKDEV